VAGIFNEAWKILRGADVASTEIVTLGGVAATLISEKRKKRTPKSLETFIGTGPLIVNEQLPTAAN
jgi:hypothetical protein